LAICAQGAEMSTLVAASIAILIALAFLGWLAYSIASIPLIVVIAIGAALMLADFYASMRRPETWN
jgi:hypothetical protein